MKELQEILKYTRDLLKTESDKSAYYHYTKLVSKIEEAIDVIHCSTQLKDKYSEDFVYFLEKKVKEQKVGSIYWYKGTGYTDLDKLFKEYQKLTKPLIV